ncbi:MAG: hypothetical protein CM15mV17_0440 [Caudoviricetes sp.]|nr:MAG: hypothetical protein CM15mV17_0440 [Caudoviricetes sp.]
MNINELIQNFHLQKEEVDKIIEKYDTDFSNKKLNPYGVTTIEFQRDLMHMLRNLDWRVLSMLSLL